MKNIAQTPIAHTLSNGRTLYLLPDPNLDIVRVDFTFEAGSVQQPYYLVAGAANQLFSEGTTLHSAAEIAEFIDFRGISLEKGIDTMVASVTVYMLRKYAAEFFPLLKEMLTQPAFAQEEFDLFCAKRRQTLLANQQKTAYVARNIFYEALYGNLHPYGGYASPDDVDRLRLHDVRQFFFSHYRLDRAHMLLSGHFDDDLVAEFDRHFAVPVSDLSPSAVDIHARVADSHPASLLRYRVHLDSPQATIRLGRVLPMRWDHPDYTHFLVLNTVLGGYFGSRLMTNIREDKGYTYGIYSQTQIYRHSIVFFITADVAAEHTQHAVDEVYHELETLRNELVPDDELDRVRSFMKGDFLRSLDGIFEQAERFKQMESAWVDANFTDHLLHSIETVTPEQLRQLARRVFDHLYDVAVGGFSE